MDIKDGVFYVVTIGEIKMIESDKSSAIKELMALVKKLGGDIEKLKPEIIEVNTKGDKWSLNGLAWNTIAIELMKLSVK
jgi:hypothetical protein